MLTESSLVFTEHTQWRKVKGSFDHDPRYKAVESSSKREEFFQEHVQGLKEDPQVGVCWVVCYWWEVVKLRVGWNHCCRRSLFPSRRGRRGFRLV